MKVNKRRPDSSLTGRNTISIYDNSRVDTNIEHYND